MGSGQIQEILVSLQPTREGSFADGQEHHEAQGRKRASGKQLGPGEKVA